jgi:hypothetical protein
MVLEFYILDDNSLVLCCKFLPMDSFRNRSLHQQKGNGGFQAAVEEKKNLGFNHMGAMA